MLERLFRRQDRKLKCFQEEYIQQGGNLYVSDLGLSQAPLAQIVGTVARCREPMASVGMRRQGRPAFGRSVSQMKRLLKRNAPVPAVVLFKLGADLYVIEGHAQVEAARQLGWGQITAYVREYLPPAGSLEGLLRREQAEFEAKTGLREISLTFPGRYPALLQQIQDHHRYLEQTRGHLFLFGEAVADWWQNLYKPVAQGLKSVGVLQDLPGFTLGDAYVYLTEYLAREARSLGIPLSKALADLISVPGADWRDKLKSIFPPCLWEGKCSK